MKALAANLTLSVLFLLWLALMALSSAPVRVSVSPRVSAAPADWTVTVRVPLEPGNVAVDAESDGYARSSAFDVDGDRSAYQIDWRDVPAGDYKIAAQFADTAGHVTAARTRAVVQGF